MTRRERLEARAERRREWAAKRAARVAAVDAEREKYRGDHAFNTQPGHIPERARLIARQERAFGDMKMAEHHEAAADGIERQLAGSIFSDDPDAAEALEAKAAAIDAECERWKAENAAFRKGAAAYAAFLGITAEQEAARRARIMENYSWQRQPHPGYRLTNARANARRLRERIKAITAQAAQVEKAEAAPGGVLVEDVSEASARITFPDYPGREIVNALKAAGFYWARPSWYGPRDKVPPQITQR